MNTKLDQKGAVAIISVVIFSIIISVLITAYLRSAVTNQQEALNYDYSNRAFYAAESGVQDTVRLLKEDPTKLVDKTSCDPLANSNPDFNAPSFGLSYNCQLIKISPTSLSGRVVPNQQSAMIRLEPSTPIIGTDSPKLVMRWSSQVPVGSTGSILYPRPDSNKLFKPVSKWNDSTRPIHPVLEVSVYDHPGSSSFTRSQINQRRVVLNPTTAGNPGVDSAVNFTKLNNNIPTQMEQLFNNAECYASDGVIPSSAGMNSYSCKQTIDIKGYDFTSSAVYVRVSSFYGATNFSLDLLNGSTPVSLKNAQATIDVTGKAGNNTFRRVQQALPLGNFQVQTGPSAALIVGQGICKQLVLGTDPSVYANSTDSCDPLRD